MEDEGLGEGWRLLMEVEMDARMIVWLVVVDARGLGMGDRELGALS